MIYNLFITNINELIFFFLLILLISICIDLIIGEIPFFIHPVVKIGKIIDYFSKYLIKIQKKYSGIILTLIVLFMVSVISIILLLIASINFYLFLAISSVFFSTTFSIKLLLSSSKKIETELNDNIDKARESMAYLVSRKTEDLSENLIISATIETLSENITDSSISPFSYYLLFGIISILLFKMNFLNSYFSTTINQLFYLTVIIAILSAMIYRSINTLDAMVGYKNEKFMKIGWFPAKIDDLLNYFSSRFSGIVVVISAFLLNMNWKNSYYILKRDSRNCDSPNSGFTMAATAGALDIQLIKEGSYIIGDENKPLKNEYITKAINLSKLTIFLSLIILSIIFLIIIYIIIYF